MHYRVIALVALGLTQVHNTFSQGTVISNPDELLGAQNAITTAVPFLAITPDARHAALGDGGVATSPDANASYWNAGKLAFIDKKYGGTISYTPWLGKIVNDMSISYLSGFYKITREQVVSVSVKYFDLGDISFRDANNNPLGDFNPREFAFDATYSRMLSENFSMGITGRYIYSNLTGAFSGIDAKPGNSVAVDIGAYYTTSFKTAKASSLSLGATVTNIGAKLSYTDNQNKDFLPTNLRLGGAYTTALDPYNSLTFILDFNKLLVPTPPIRSTDGSIIYGKDDNRSVLGGMFGSFSDAPNGFKEEMQEIMTSIGIEYWYDNTFAGRVGYFNEAQNKGNRKYMTVGLGFRKKQFGIDVAYLVPVNKRESPLAETLRFTLLFQLQQTDSEKKESVTD
ncbi:MAG: type IX secretion system outer membrane channel protein PorV [Cyclobacteriaceae bacterium]|nr:type IX secretion system outer membrane channel protein PorV [Cyclobacteriaceae bacterium]